jgi:hypothetical protein
VVGRIAKLRQCFAHGDAQGRVIFHQQNGFSAAAQGRDCWRCGFHDDITGQSRQIDAERRPLANFARNIDPALMLLDDAEDGCQPHLRSIFSGSSTANKCETI